MANYKAEVAEARKLLEKIQIPMLPNELVELQTLLNGHEMPNLSLVVELISHNPYLAAELVAIANSPMFNPRLITVQDLESVIFRLGVQNLRHYILSIHVKKQILDKGYKGLSFHSQSIAIISAAIAIHVNGIKKTDAYLIGLIHDIGSFAIHQLDQNYGILFNGQQVEFNSTTEQEFNRYGTSHSAFGYVMAKEMKLPEDLARIILLHHEEKLSSIRNHEIRLKVALLEIAHLINSKRINKKPDLTPEQKKLFEESRQILDLTQTDIDKIEKEIETYLS